MALDLSKDYVLIIEDTSGKVLEDRSCKISKYTFEGNSLYQIDGEQFYIEYFNDFDRIKVDIPCDISVQNTQSKYRVREIWQINDTMLTKIYSNYKK